MLALENTMFKKVVENFKKTIPNHETPTTFAENKENEEPTSKNESMDDDPVSDTNETQELVSNDETPIEEDNDKLNDLIKIEQVENRT